MSKTITISTDVFARIWALRSPGEDSEDAILRRVLECSATPNPATGIRPKSGLKDRRYGVEFPEGFGIFRTYLGERYDARVVSDHWQLLNDGRRFNSLNELSRAIGARTENAWMNWFILDTGGQRKPVGSLREPTKIHDRTPSTQSIEGGKTMGMISHVPDATWRDDIVATLRNLGGVAHLSRIYKEAEQIRRAANRTLPPSFDAVVRRTLEENSSDSESYRGGPDLFRMSEGRGSGVWELRIR
jgi:hypothetical protein